MEINTFVSAAILGGWKIKGVLGLTAETFLRDNNIEAIFLDPLAWQAVGKVEEWGTDGKFKHSDLCQVPFSAFCGIKDSSANNCYEYQGECWKDKMLKMTQALIEGKSIKEYIATL